MRVRLATAFVALFLFTSLAVPAGAHAADAAVTAPRKVVIIVGPTAISQSTYVPMADTLAATATTAGAAVTKLYCKDATEAQVLAATAGANIIVYFGHGNGFPNPYTTPAYTYDAGQIYPAGTNGWGLAKGGTSCNDDNLRYYGESWITANVKPAPGFTMIYSNACYTPGAGEDEAGHPTDERMAWTRVGYYSRGVLGMGAGAYFASDLWHGSSSLVDQILRNPTMTYGEIFKRASGYSAAALRPYVHPTLANRQVWLHRSGDWQGLQSYWYAFAGNPNNTPSNANAAPPAAPPAPSVLPVERIAGADRYATAALTSQRNFSPSGPVAYVATGANFPDALAAGAAAAKHGAPVLLVTSSGIPAATAAELTRLRPTRIVVVGASGVVGDGVAGALAGYATSGEVERIGGADRYATAAAVSARTFDPQVPVVSIATGVNFPDALAGVSPTAMQDGPILLVSPAGIPAATAAELARLQPGKILIFGSTGVVSETIAAQLAGYAGGNVQRLAGADRYATAVAISAGTFASADTVYVATGRNFPDALAAGPVAGLNSGPLLLVPGTSVPPNVQAELRRLDPEEVVILGAEGVVSSAVVAQIQAAVGG
ncbi:MAG: cell wall-binding repeat-containing protein [Chloroflexota bacterium]